MIVEGIIVEVQRKLIKNIHIHVKAPDGKVIVTTPKQTKDDIIIKVIKEKAIWIKKQQKQMEERKSRLRNDDINWEEQSEQLQLDIAELLPKWEKITGLSCWTWRIRKMKTRWGSCNVKTKKIWFNLYLAQTSKRCLEYIILHELLHLKVANHGKEFKDNMDKYMPDWRVVRKELNQFIIF